MSDWQTYRDRTTESAVQAAARALVAEPGCRVRDYVARCAPHGAYAVRQAIQRLRGMGLVRAERPHGQRHNHATAMHPTPPLVRMIAAGVPVVSCRSGRRQITEDDVLEDDGWTPPTHYVTASQAWARGLRRSA